MLPSRGVEQSGWQWTEVCSE